jgi:hypothetical protein
MRQARRPFSLRPCGHRPRRRPLEKNRSRCPCGLTRLAGQRCMRLTRREIQFPRFLATASHRRCPIRSGRRPPTPTGPTHVIVQGADRKHPRRSMRDRDGTNTQSHRGARCPPLVCGWWRRVWLVARLVSAHERDISDGPVCRTGPVRSGQRHVRLPDLPATDYAPPGRHSDSR